MTGVRLKSMSSNILRVMVLPSTPEMKNETVASSNEARKAKTRAGGDAGQDVRQHDVEERLGARGAAIERGELERGSKRCSAAVTVMTT